VSGGRAVAVTGMGVVSPLGHDVGSFARRMFAGESGVVDLRGRLLPAGFPVPYGGVVSRDGLPRPRLAAPAGSRPAPAANLFAAVATEEALAPLPPDLPVDGIVYGTAEGMGYELVEESFAAGRLSAEAFPWAESRPESSVEVIAGILAARGHGLLPPAAGIPVASACASGNQAIGLAFQRIRAGRWRRAVVGGVDARLLPANLMSFHLLSALAVEDCPPERASRPFSIDRTGFVRSEGAATLVLEEREEAAARGAEVLGLVRGYGHTTDAFHTTEGREDCEAVVKAMAAAIADAGLDADAIDAVSAHGTATVLGDRLETKALKLLFGRAARAKPVTALKSQIGHSTVAAAAIEAVSCLLMLRAQTLAPTINYREEEIDPDCDLDYVPNRARPAPVALMLSNALGFGGHNACVVFERAQ
jgi:3-oxoacyl-[acyl-carrier-protein] synthase II